MTEPSCTEPQLPETDAEGQLCQPPPELPQSYLQDQPWPEEYDVSYNSASFLRKIVVSDFPESAHTQDMSDAIERRRENFRAWMEASSLTVADIHRATKCPATTLYSYLAGKSDSLKGTTQERITAHYGVTAEVLFGGTDTKKQEVGVWGKIGAGAEVNPLSDYDSVPMYEISLPPGLDPHQEYVGFEIEGFSMPPAQPGWVVIFRKVALPTDDLLGFPCLIDTDDGKRLFKVLRRGYAPGMFNLESWDGSPLLEGVRITAALPFVSLSPGRKAR